MIDYADPAKTSCENHDTGGQCDEECLTLAHMMQGDPGHVPYDPTGCSYPEPSAEYTPFLDTVNHRIYYDYVHEWETPFGRMYGVVVPLDEEATAAGFTSMRLVGDQTPFGSSVKYHDGTQFTFLDPMYGGRVTSTPEEKAAEKAAKNGANL